MNSIHNNGENDKTINDELDQLGGVYAQLEQHEPPDLIDQAILNRAHRAVEKKPHWIKFGWLQGLSTAAVFVLAFSMILQQSTPVPTHQDGIENREMMAPEAEQTARAKKELRAKPDLQQAVPQNLGAAFDGAKSETSAGDEMPQPALKDQAASYAERPLADDNMAVNEEAASEILFQEYKLSDEADFALDADQEEILMVPASPVTTTLSEQEPVLARSTTETSIEQQLQAIIRLKESADETWVTALASFTERYPEYPLPKELTD
jgi:hypothetical protein